MQSYQHMSIKGKNVVCAVNDGMTTISHVTKCTVVPGEMLLAKGLSGFVW